MTDAKQTNPIGKEQWLRIEEYLRGGYVHVTFRLAENIFQVERVKFSESKTALAVYIDGKIGHWGLPQSEGYRPVVETVWRKRTRAFYTEQQIRRIEKAYGKRKGNKVFPKLHARQTWYEFSFPKSKTLCTQFKKIPGLELVSMGFES